MKKILFGLSMISVISASLVFASAGINTSGTMLSFEERTANDKTEDGASLDRAYITTLKYNPTTKSIVSEYAEAKKKNTPATLDAIETSASVYSYKLFGVYKDDENKDVYYQDTKFSPLSINADGDLFFSSYVQSDDLDYELMDYNKGRYQVTVNAYDKNDLDDEGNPKEIAGSGSVFTITLANNLDEYTITPLYQSILAVAPGTPGERKQFNLSLPITKATEVANFSSAIKNERNNTDSSYVLKYILSANPSDEKCEEDSSFFTLDEKTGKMSFKNEEALSEECLEIKKTKTKYEMMKLSISAYKIIKSPLGFRSIILSDTTTAAEPDISDEAYYSESYTVSVQLYTPTVGVAATAEPVASSIVTNTTGSSNTGGYDLLISVTPLPCEQITYKRYPNNRGKGVNAGLFRDADIYHRAYKALIDLGEQKVVNGDQATGKARLDDPISRAEFVKIVTVGRQDTLGTDLCLKSSLFPDVLNSDWFSRFVWNMETRKFVSGYDDGFYRPSKNINLVETYKIIALAFGYITPEDTALAIKNTGVEWYVPYKRVLESAEVIPSWFASYRLDQPITRGDMFALLSNVLKDIDGVL